ncbi:hypothetical protein BRC74_04780 [Halobacteriales archaeon QH_7_68_42]|nr:MAG: hypothetical protein BRC74_04780 [Halobacteriales archaeon QH_7_68_42]
MSVLAELVALRRDADDPIRIDTGDTAAGPWAGDRPAMTDDAADGTDGEPAHEGTPSDGTDTAVDPVCGMDVTVDEDTPTVEHGGREYRFCGQECADAFTGEPDRYAEVDTDA